MFVAEGFGLVQQVFKDNFDVYNDIGAACCVRWNGKVVVDLYAGWHNDTVDPPIPWKEDTITNVYSCTKAMANICVLKLIEQGYLSFDATIASVWADFGQNGKECITVEQLLTHQAALMTLGETRVTSEELIEWTDYLHGNASPPPLYLAVVSQKPLWKIQKDRFGYHPLTIGLYLSELVRHADPKNRSVQTFWKQEIADPFGIEFYIGLPKDFDSSRLARLVSTPTIEDGQVKEGVKIPQRVSSRLPAVKISKEYETPPIPLEIENELPQMISTSFTFVKRFSPWKTRFAELPSGIGFGNARSLSKAFGLLACAAKGTERNPIIATHIARKALELSVEGFDLTSMTHRSLSRSGYFLSEQYPNSFHHYGNGGALVWGDSHYGLGLSYTPSHLLSSATHNTGTRGEKLVKAVYYCLSQLESSMNSKL